MIKWTIEQIFSRQTFLESLWFGIDGNLLVVFNSYSKKVLTKKADVKNRKWKTKETKLFQVPPLASAWRSTFNYINETIFLLTEQQKYIEHAYWFYSIVLKVSAVYFEP
jgi:hypothetical protein